MGNRQYTIKAHIPGAGLSDTAALGVYGPDGCQLARTGWRDGGEEMTVQVSATTSGPIHLYVFDQWSTTYGPPLATHSMTVELPPPGTTSWDQSQVVNGLVARITGPA